MVCPSVEVEIVKAVGRDDAADATELRDGVSKFGVKGRGRMNHHAAGPIGDDGHAGGAGDSDAGKGIANSGAIHRPQTFVDGCQRVLRKVGRVGHCRT